MTLTSKFFLGMVILNLIFFVINITHGVIKPSMFSILIGLLNLGAAVFLLFVRTKLE